MRDDVAADLSKSAEAFAGIVWPAIREAIGGGELIPVESVTSTGFAAKLDQIAGIDAWVIQQDAHMFGLASRVQWPDGRPGWPYKTFTIRMSRPTGSVTEFAKRKQQIATDGSLYPRWTCHAYVAEGALVTAAFALTKHVIKAVEMNIGRERTVYDGVKFWAVPWAALWTAGCKSLCVVDANGVHRQEAA